MPDRPPAPKQPPVIVLRPDPKKPGGPPGSKATLDAPLALPGGKPYRPYIGQIKLAATNWGADPVEILATLIWEGGRANETPNASGAIGLAQIVDRAVRQDLNPTQYGRFTATFGSEITPEKAADPAFAVNYLAWRMAGRRARERPVGSARECRGGPLPAEHSSFTGGQGGRSGWPRRSEGGDHR